MKYRAMFVVLGLFLCGLAQGDEPLKSGLQPKERIPGAFEPLNVTGAHAGESYCLVCENGVNPVVAVFARDVNEPLVKLLGQIDVATGKHQKKQMGSFAVFLSEKQTLAQQLQEVAKKNAFKNIVLSIDKPAGPEDYKLVKEAETTVVLYYNYEVKANHAFRKGELNDQAIARIVADIPKIVPAK